MSPAEFYTIFIRFRLGKFSGLGHKIQIESYTALSKREHVFIDSWKVHDNNLSSQIHKSQRIMCFSMKLGEESECIINTKKAQYMDNKVA